MKYYHLSSTKLPNILKPTGYYEEVNGGGLNFWYPLSNSPPIFRSSNILESCFSKTPAGTLFGVFSDGGKAGTYYLYSTSEKPDVNLTHEMVQDFGVIEEVRYRRPVSVQLEGKLSIPKSVINDILQCHVETEEGESFFNDEEGYQLKKQINVWIKKNLR